MGAKAASWALFVVATTSACSLVLGMEDKHPLDDGGTVQAGDASVDGTATPSDGGSEGGGGGSVSFGEPIKVASDQAQPKAIAVDAKEIFWTSGDKVQAIAKAGGPAPRLLALGEVGLGNELDVDAVKVYWTAASFALRQCGKTSGTPVNFGQSYASKRAHFTPTTIFYSFNDRMARVERDGTGSADLVTGEPNIGPVLGDGESLFYASTTSGFVYRLHIPTVQKLPFASNQGPIADLRMDTTTVYWATTGGKILKLDKDKISQPPTTLAEGLGQIVRMILDGSTIYYTSVDRGIVGSVPKAGGDVTVIAKEQAQPWGVAVDKEGIYWANSGDGTVWRAPAR